MKHGQPAPSWEDEDLVEACRAGQQAGWDALVEKYSRLVYSVAARYQLPPEEAADAFQSVWLDLYRDLGNLQKAASVRSWLLTAASRRCLLQKRRGQRTVTGLDAEVVLVDSAPDPLVIQQEVERQDTVHRAIELLPERCRTLVRILFFEQPPVSYAEAARRLGLAEGSIGFIRGRCLGKLRKAMAELGMG